VQQTIQRELVGARLEDIARKQRQGKTVYETDIIKDGYKWEVVIGEDGQVVSRLQEGKAGAEPVGKAKASAATGAGWRETFAVSKSDLAPTGHNPWLTIQPGRVLELRNGIDSLTITILSESMTVDGVKVGVLEERETKDGKLAEVSRNFFATDKNTGDVYYFGEEVDNYKDGRIVDHDSAWRAGEKGARFGLMIPGRPQAGDRFYQIASELKSKGADRPALEERFRELLPYRLRADDRLPSAAARSTDIGNDCLTLALFRLARVKLANSPSEGDNLGMDFHLRVWTLDGRFPESEIRRAQKTIEHLEKTVGIKISSGSSSRHWNRETCRTPLAAPISHGLF